MHPYPLSVGLDVMSLSKVEAWLELSTDFLVPKLSDCWPVCFVLSGVITVHIEATRLGHVQVGLGGIL